MSKIKLFTHTDLDGIGCAILAYLAFGRESVDVEYCDYGDINEKVEEFWDDPELEAYDYIFITDISIKEKLAIHITNEASEPRVLLFDHHATALGLNKYDWCEISVMNDTLGIKTSGTELFYNYLRRHEQFDHLSVNVIGNIDEFVDIVRDYDTWRWKELGKEGIVCKQMNDLFYIYGREVFIDWALDQILTLKFYRGISAFPIYSEKDMALLDQKQKDIDTYIEEKNKQLFHRVDEVGHTYGVVFAERYFSELGNRLCEINPDLAYIAMIDISSGTVSYRTIRDDIDVGGEIAHAYGGGGHPKAAGSTFDKDQIQCTVHGLIFSDKQHNEL
jgi:oligoribonuclease NrnB/cAMP/cGMP phosphodiesterase (DHH superfamily)